MNKKAVNIINRVRDKLTGRDFATEDPVDVQRQVELLIQQATSHENLCQCYIGWSVPLVWCVCVCVCVCVSHKNAVRAEGLVPLLWAEGRDRARKTTQAISVFGTGCADGVVHVSRALD